MRSSRGVTAVAVIITTLVHVATSSAISSAISSSSASAYRAFREVYTTNAICTKKHCVNPIFPGLEDLQRLERAPWITSSLQKTSTSMGFCRSAITYDPALPIPAGGADTLKRMVERQDNAAATMFFYHIYSLGWEAWDFPKPWLANDCVKSIWRMVCYTYFPRAQVGTMDGAYSKYIRPCQSGCANYIRTCNVECCDESVQCVFSHTKAISHTANVTSQGYVPHDGPSSLCTGGARPSATPLGAGLWALVILKVLFSFDGASISGGLRSLFAGMGGRKLILIGCISVVALSLQGCAYDVPVHRIGNWRAEPDYLIKHEYIPPGGSATLVSINSCSMPRLSLTLQCSGRGTCARWGTNVDNMLSFCECDRGWADPECRTPRKSQTIAYLLSMFFGIFGADQFYLGFIAMGAFKLLTLGGGGVWWVYDIVRIGSAPVYSHSFRTAADLPHWAFVISCVMYAGFLGFAVAYILTTTYRARKRKEAILLSQTEEARQGQINLFADAYQTKPIKQQGQNYGTSIGTRTQPQYLKSNPVIAGGGTMYPPMGPMPPMPGWWDTMSPMGGMGPMPSTGPMGGMGPMGP